MPSVQRSVVIARPVDEVFGYFADPMTGKEWRTALAEVSARLDLPLGVTRVPKGRSRLAPSSGSGSPAPEVAPSRLTSG